jgi:hypothetical protein
MISLSPDINFAILTNYYLCLITENNMRPLIYCPVQFAGGWLEKLWFFFIHYSTFVPFQNSLLQTVLDETLQPVLWLNLAVTSFRVCRLFVFTLRKRILSSRGVFFRIPPLRGKFSMFPLSLIRFKSFWIVLLLMPVIFCFL